MTGGLEHAKPGMVLGCENHVSYTSNPSQPRPLVRIEPARAEVLREKAEVTFDVSIGSTDQGMTDDASQLAIKAPMNEKAKTEIPKPFQPLTPIA
jgi:hypothetical protein